LLLTVGQVEQAQQHLNNVQQESQQNANVLALQSIIALAKSDQQQALKLAEQAQQVNSQTAAPKIALSYVYQSLFDIDKALNSATEAAQADPNNGLAWARVSEMELATGNVDASMDAASKAQTLNPQLSKTNIVLGFARLASLDLSEAEQSFRTAIKRDPSDPLARLGLGLAKIRQGHIKSGTKEMETAANLDPDNALIRSYLGKAYYEQRRGDVASTEYAIAKKLDPNDPTPWFYDAIYKQTVNRPVEALHDIQKAIELNDNRAVYRSKLLLDQDLASRSAALGRIYNDLGFQQRGLVEGWKSANADPGNYSAHRLLADNYAALPRHEIARVSELLQSQLLQPINITPVQPQLAESNLLVVDGLGPQSSSFNEFNPLFARNRFALQGSGIYGSNNTWGEEVTQSGLWNNFSYSLGQFHYQTDGFRNNNDLKQDIYNLFLQTSFSTNTSIQFEYRKKDLSFGDLGLPFDINNIDESIRNSQHSDSVRLGFLHTFTPSSKILGSVIYQDLDIKQRDDFSNTKIKDNGYIGELQYQFTSPVLNSILGIGYFDVDSKTKSSFVDELNEPNDDKFKEIIRHANLYAYANLRFPSDITWTVGLSLDNVNNDVADITKLNPKLGISWQATPKTLVRIAAFRTLTKDVIQDQTIEPTQVAGFNQYFDEIRSITAWRYGAAIDHKFSNQIFSGIEFSQRDLEVPFQSLEFDVLGNELIDIDSADFREQLGRVYFYWTPTKWIAASLAYQFERFTTEQKLADENILDLKTHRVPIQLSLILPSGLTVRTKATYINQQGSFFDSGIPPNGLVFYDKDKFWVFDTSLSYRLPKRMGLVSLEVKNLLNNHFNFQDAIPGRSASSIDQPTVALGRVILGKLTLSF
jgi:tetratricopeptide (TPR) repeat protein